MLPGGDLIAPLLNDGRTDGLAPDLDPACNTQVACPAELPGPTPARAPQDGEDIGPLDNPVVVDTADARTLTCYDVDTEPATPSYRNELGLLVSGSGEQLPEPRGLSATGLLWQFDSTDNDNNDDTDNGRIETRPWARSTGGSSTSLTWYQDTRAIPTALTIIGDRVVWSERAAADTSPRVSFIRTLIVDGDKSTAVMDPLVTSQEPLSLIATTQDRALWTAGAMDDDTRLFATTLDGDGTPTELATGVTALAADDNEAVAPVRNQGAGGTSSTTIRRFDDLPGGDLTGTVLAQFEHDAAAEVAALAVSDDVVVWTVQPVDAGSGAGALYVLDRLGGDSVVRLPGGGVDDLRASGGRSCGPAPTPGTRTQPIRPSCTGRRRRPPSMTVRTSPGSRAVP